jgi:DNA-binding transcriptional MerR regulator
MKNSKHYTSQEAAEILGISKRTLYRYEKEGIFPEAPRNPINNWRQYTEEHIEKLLNIITA